MYWYEDEEELDVNRLGLGSSSGIEKQDVTLSYHSGDE